MPADPDVRWMQAAIAAAERAAERDEVPIGAVIICGNELVAVAHNERELRPDPTAHAEILAMRRAARALGRWRLSGCTLYVTLEPCPMCAGALVNARVDRLVYGADDPKAGAIRSLFRVADDARLNHRLELRGGVAADRCSHLLRTFFRAKRRP